MIFTTSTPFDRAGQASKLSLQADKARMFGNMHEASELHAKAGAVLEADVVNKIKKSDKDVIRFLAATQYYLGGHFAKALEVCRRIQANTLPERERRLYGAFLKTIRERAKPDYSRKMRERLGQHWLRREYQQIIDLLKEHRYVIGDDSKLAEIRGVCLERLGDYQAAALFLSSAVSKAPDDPQVVFLAAGAPLQMLAKRQLVDAWKYSQYLLEKIAHPLTPLTAAIVRFHQAALSSDSNEQKTVHEDLLRLFHQAEEPFFQLPESVRIRADYRELMILGFLDAAVANCYLGNLSQAREIYGRAVAFAPDDSLVRALGVIMKSPHPNTEEAARKVIEFGEQLHPQSERVFDQLAA